MTKDQTAQRLIAYLEHGLEQAAKDVTEATNRYNTTQALLTAARTIQAEEAKKHNGDGAAN